MYSSLRISVFAVSLMALLAAFSPFTDEYRPAPELRGVDIDGDRVALSELAAERPVYLKFWATWCVACLEEMPEFTEWHAKFGEQIEFIAINVAINDSIARIRATQEEFGMRMLILFDEDGELWDRYDIFGTPTHIIIQDDKIIYTSMAASSKLEQILTLLAAGERAE